MVIERVNTKISPGLGRSQPIQTPKFIELFVSGLFRKSAPPRDINPSLTSDQQVNTIEPTETHQHNAHYYKAITEKVLAHQKQNSRPQYSDAKEEFYKEASKELVGLIIETQGGQLLRKVAAQGIVGALGRLT